ELLSFAVPNQRDLTLVEHDQRDRAPRIEVPDQALPVHLSEQHPCAHQLGLQYRPQAMHLLELPSQLLETRATRGEPPNLELPELPGKLPAPHRHPVVEKAEAARP